MIVNLLRVAMLCACCAGVIVSFGEHSQLFLETGYRLSMLATASTVTLTWIDEVRRGV